ncbi:MAG: Trp biosynthesis-associated membrane protein [Actinomycetes bacterium]
MGSRGYGIALLALAAGGIGLVVAYGMTWAMSDVALLPGADSVQQVSVSGRDLHPWAGAAGWVALAAVAGIIATRSWGRTVVAGIGLLAGVAASAGALMGAADPERVGYGWLLALASGLVVVVACAVTVVRGRGWPALGSRYERRGRQARHLTAWEAQDLGRDPTDDLVE